MLSNNSKSIFSKSTERTSNKLVALCALRRKVSYLFVDISSCFHCSGHQLQLHPVPLCCLSQEKVSNASQWWIDSDCRIDISQKYRQMETGIIASCSQLKLYKISDIPTAARLKRFLAFLQSEKVPGADSSTSSSLDQRTSPYILRL